MVWRPTLWLLTLTALTRAADDIHHEDTRTLHRLVAGHLRVNQPDLIAASAGGGKDKKTQKPHKDDEVKTLSQQVADGKYGLIQKELFSKPVKKPGVLSYEANPEVPKDNIRNLGGLHKNEIWLAENHLLVLKGGNYPVHDDRNEDNPQSLWPPIDDYKAPLRQVKIPSHPKVPPPFPVQLEEGGPLQLLGTNNSRTFNGTIDETVFAVPPPEGYVPGTGPYFPPVYQYPPNITTGETPFPITPNAPPSIPGEYHPGDGSPPPFPIPLNGTYFASLPPGAAIVPPPDNQTDVYDEDDPSIFYPPPYSFFYPKDNSTEVPPGPLVPGIILPPPPNFFAPLEERRRPTTTDATKQIRPTTTPLPPTRKIPPKITYLPTEINNELNPATVVTILPAKYKTTTTARPPQRKKQPSVTILKPVNYNENEVSSGKPFPVYGPPQNATTPPKTPRVYNGDVPPQYYYYEDVTKKPPPPSQYYYYNEVTTPRPQIFYVTSKPSPPPTTQRPRFRLQTTKPDTFKIHIARLRQHLQSYITQRPNNPKPVYQYSFQAKEPKYSVQIQPAVEIIPNQQQPTPSPGYYQANSEQPSQYYSTPRPIAQYSFEVTQNPIYQNYYTKNDEKYLDDITKKYFTTVFGKKLPGGTTPLPRVQSTTSRPVYVPQKPISLESDILVNYAQPRPNINPDAEYIDNAQPPNNKPEIVQAISVPNNQQNSYISYQLPGDEGAHFYFLTPQLVKRTDQGAGYYYASRKKRSDR